MDPQNQQYNMPMQPMQPVQPKRTGMIIGVIIGIILVILLGVIIFLLLPGKSSVEIEVKQDADEIQESADDVSDSSQPAVSIPAVSIPAVTQTTNTQVTQPSQPAVTPSAPVASTADFAGEWDGTYASSPVAGKACEASGSTSFSIQSNGSVVGYATIKGVKVPGTGSIDSNGNLKGSWNYAGLPLSYTGKLNSKTDEGSGTYSNTAGCFGSFSIER